MKRMSVWRDLVDALVNQQGAPRDKAIEFIGRHRQRQEVYFLFEREAARLIAENPTKGIGAKQIYEALRRGTENLSRQGLFVLSNDWTPYYARLYAIYHPEHAHHFKFKRLVGGTPAPQQLQLLPRSAA